MTIAISLKINDGLVLAADSASTLVTENSQVFNVYNNANKVFNLCKGLPIGAITWGAGNIGSASTSTLIKDFRRLLSESGEEGKDKILNREAYEILNVAEKLREFIFEEHYLPEFKDSQEKPRLGFIVAGYSTDSNMAEEYRIDIVDGECAEPKLLRQKENSGITWSGEGEAISRLILGFGSQLPRILQEELNVPGEQISPVMDIIQRNLMAPLVVPAMPLQDAIDLARFLAETTLGFSRYTPGAQTVGGLIEIAAISKHEGFKWVSRKHYFSAESNPEG